VSESLQTSDLVSDAAGIPFALARSKASDRFFDSYFGSTHFSTKVWQEKMFQFRDQNAWKRPLFLNSKLTEYYIILILFLMEVIVCQC
jgi:hypothetical protein